MKSFSFVLFCASLLTCAAVCFAQDASIGRTGWMPGERFIVGGNIPARLAQPGEAVPVSSRRGDREGVARPSGAAWALVDSFSARVTIPAGKRFDIACSQMKEKLIPGVPIEPLTAKAEQAIARAPRWLRDALADNLRRLAAPALQDRFAQLILDETDPYVDEVAFCVAHLPVQVLTSGSFDPSLLPLNARLIYQYDQSLDYVQIVDTGTSADEDYFTTARYTVADTAGAISTIELPRDMYYWYVVQPKLSDEIPAFIDPSTGSPAPPPAGRFWREFLWSANDAGYPLLKDKLQGIGAAWQARVNEDSARNGAIGMVSRWVKTVMQFGAGAERPIQPVRIYRLHKGNCGEWADISDAAARTALIPCTNSDAPGDDHTWNEFWFGRWIHWEPTNVFLDSPRSYENWGWVLGAVDNWRGDSWYDRATARYTPSCTLRVHVGDAADHPVDGARVTIAAHFRARDSSAIMISTFAYTDANGDALLSLGDGKKIYLRVDGSAGSVPSQQNQVIQVIDNSAANGQYTWSTKLPGTLALPAPQSPPPIYAPVNQYRLDVSLSVPNEIMYGRNIYDAARSEFSNPAPGGNVTAFLLDEENYARYLAGQSFAAGRVESNVSSTGFSFLLPTRSDWHLVLSNEEKAANKQAVEARVLLARGDAPPAGTIDGTITLTGAGDNSGALIAADTGERDSTGTAGTFRLRDVTAGRHIIRVSAPGYVSRQIDTIIAAGSTTTLNVALMPGLTAPVSLRASLNGTLVDLAWDPVPAPNFLGYNVYRQTSPGIDPRNAQPLNGAPLPDPAYRDSTAAAGQTFYYCVTALYAAGMSAASNEISVTVPGTLELTYDDGQAEGSLGLTQVVNGGMAVRFTPAFYPAKIQAVKIFVRHLFNDVDVQCWKGSGTPSQEMISPVRLQRGSVPDQSWATVDVSNRNAVVTAGDFWAGIVYLATNTGQYSDCYIGADTTFAGSTFQNRSWVKFPQGWYLLSAVNNGQYKWDLQIRAVIAGITGVEEEQEISPSEITSFFGYPNPLSASGGFRLATIGFTLRRSACATLRLFNALGRPVATLLSDNLEEGSHQLRWSPGGLPAGLYVLKLSTDRETRTRKVLIVR